MIKHGSPPYLECSSAGDRRFSAFYAHVNGKTIEHQYQAAKIFRNGDTGLSIKEAKGFRPVNAKEVAKLYADLWDQYIAENPHLIPILVAASGLSDRFGRPGSVCQATELWRIRSQHSTPKEPTCT